MLIPFSLLGPGTAGSVKKNVVPLPTSDSTQILPPCCSTIRLQLADPVPVLGYSLRGRSYSDLHFDLATLVVLLVISKIVCIILGRIPYCEMLGEFFIERPYARAVD